MSAIRFHFGEGEILQVRGMERSAMDLHINQITVGAGRLSSGMGERWDDQEVALCYGKFLGLTEAEIKEPQAGLARRVAMSFSGHSQNGLFSWKGKEIDPWCLSLNTALAVGSDPIRLAVRIHAQCEIHGFVEGEDRKWFANLIEEGIEDGVFRRSHLNRDDECCSMGWTELVEKLREVPGHPVVMSFSVTDGFPNPPDNWRPEVTDDERWDQWDELDDWKQFHLALSDIRGQEGMEPISSKTLRSRFGHGLSLLDLAANDMKKIEKALGIEGE